MTIVTNYSQFFSIFFLLCRIVSPNKDSTELFIESPGDCEEFVYSPVGVNATLHCAVNSTILTWFIDGTLTFDSLAQKLELHSRGIYQSGPTTSMDGITVSDVTVYGNSENNNRRICCQSFVNGLKENCTTVIIYDRPLPPTQVSVQTAGGVDLLNISWTATTMTGVNQTYIIVFDTLTIKAANTHHIFYQEFTSTGNCGLFLAFVKAVNGAGESDPSINVSIPSLPDIGPVTASLTHHVWKHNGEIRVNVSFQPARFCLDYPVMSYVLLLRILCMGETTRVILKANETEAVFTPENGLEANQKYNYTVTALNAIGSVTSHQHGINFFTSDVQSVSAIAVDESTIAIQCLFIHGSDALGCKVVLVSNCTNVRNICTIITRSSSTMITSASRRLSLTHNISCYHKLLAFGIDINDTISNLTIEGIIYTLMINDEPTDGAPLSIAIVTIPSVLILLIAFILIMVVTVSVALYKQRNYKENSSVPEASCISRCLSDCTCTKYLPAKSKDKNMYTQQTPSIHRENDENYGSSNNVEDNECAKVTQPPLYSVPDTTQVVYEEPYDWAVSRLPQIEPVLEQCPAYGVLTK